MSRCGKRMLAGEVRVGITEWSEVWLDSNHLGEVKRPISIQDHEVRHSASVRNPTL
jgi:hypothetical protein